MLMCTWIQNGIKLIHLCVDCFALIMIYFQNFYLIDPYLAAFLCLLMIRRPVWCIVQEVCIGQGRGSQFLLCSISIAPLLPKFYRDMSYEEWKMYR